MAAGFALNPVPNPPFLAGALTTFFSSFFSSLAGAFPPLPFAAGAGFLTGSSLAFALAFPAFEPFAGPPYIFIYIFYNKAFQFFVNFF